MSVTSEITEQRSPNMQEKTIPIATLRAFKHRTDTGHTNYNLVSNLGFVPTGINRFGTRVKIWKS